MSDRLYGEDYFNPSEENRFAANELTPKAQAAYNAAKIQLEIGKLDERINQLTGMINSLQSELNNAEAKKTELLSSFSRPQSVDVEKPVVK